MAQKVFSDTVCDVCAKQGNDTHAESIPPIAINGTGPLELDLCADHRAEYYDPIAPLIELLKAEGRTADGKRPRGRAGSKLEDAVPEQPKPAAKKRATAKKKAKAEAEPKAESETPQGECPDCGQTGLKNVGAHRFRKHGIRQGEAVSA